MASCWSIREHCMQLRVVALLGLVLVCCPLGAVAAERCVLFEDFTATWCGPCHTTGTSLGTLQDTYPDTSAVLQAHISDDFTLPWSTGRCNSYGNSGYIPNVWVDGVIQKVGSAPFSTYNYYYNQRQAVPTYVTVDFVKAELNWGTNYAFTVEVSMEDGGTPMTVRVYVARALDYHPYNHTYTYYRNCLMEMAATEDVYLEPGMSATVERNLTFDTTSWSRPDDIRMFAWAQDPTTVMGPKEVYNSTMTYGWPMTFTGDMNCDGEVNFGDVQPFANALADAGAWQATYPDCNIMNGDVNGDGQFNFGDIQAFVGLLAGK